MLLLSLIRMADRDSITYFSFLTFNGKNIYPELEHDPEITLTKADVKQLCDETKAAAEKWFEGKNDDWLEKPLFETFTNFDNTTAQLRHILLLIHPAGIFYPRFISSAAARSVSGSLSR